MVMGALSKSLDEIRKTQRADGPARIMAIGTAYPPNQVFQAEYPDYYFHITNRAIDGHLKEVRLTFHLLKTAPGHISKNIEKCLEEAFKPLRISDRNFLLDSSPWRSCHSGQN
ncbi:unnamed protein product [Brassica napus]|uniref:(rape) hypothetical protein n=1 Tax=Brassica napus TaxID=3708 RepID=A0A816KG30_BRANA|nr:unnamed protein product [Brassica napus]